MSLLKVSCVGKRGCEWWSTARKLMKSSAEK